MWCCVSSIVEIMWVVWEVKKVGEKLLDMPNGVTILPGSPLGAAPERWGSYR